MIQDYLSFRRAQKNKTTVPPQNHPHSRPLHRLHSIKHLHESLRILRTPNLILPLQRKVRHTAHPHHLRLRHLPIHLFPALVAPQPLLHLPLLQPRLYARVLQNRMGGDIPLLLKVRLEQLLHDARLHLGGFGLGELDQAVRVARVARFAAEFEVDADVLSDGGQPLEDQRGFLGAEFLGVVGAFVDARRWGVGIEVEREPGCGEGVGGLGVGAFVGGDAGFEFLFADVALEMGRLVDGV